MNRLKHHVLSSMFVTVIAILVAGCGFRTTGAVPTTTPGVSCTTWHLVSSPNPSASKSTLTSVTALSARNAWAVGRSSPINVLQYSTSSTLIEHWNGMNWSIVPSPDPGAGGNDLLGVANLSATDIWAVGDFLNGAQSTGPTLIEHWDGAHWHVVSSPNVESKSNILAGVAAVSSKDIWAVGEAYDSGNGPSLIEHWNGQVWSIVSSPNAPSFAYASLTSVTALSAKDVWAVGYSANNNDNPSGGGFVSEPTLIEHWDGIAWNIVPSPNSPFKYNQLKSVIAVKANDIWAVGASFDSFYGVSHTLIEHWNGQKWSIVSSPSPESKSMTLSGITAVSENDIWAVGVYSNTSTDTSGTGPSLIEHWNGKQWRIISNPNIAVLGGLLGVTQVPQTNNLMAVGTDGSQTLTEFAC